MDHRVSHVGCVGRDRWTSQSITKGIKGNPTGQSTARRENRIGLVHNLIEARGGSLTR